MSFKADIAQSQTEALAAVHHQASLDVSTQDGGNDPVVISAPAHPSKLFADGLEFKNRFHILTNNPLPEFSTVCADAFEAAEPGDANRRCLALVTKPGMPIRFGAIAALSGVTLPGIMSVLDQAPIDWPLTGDKRYVFIMNRPEGDRLQSLQGSIVRMGEQDIIKNVAEPAAASLRELHNRKLTFRGFSVDNLYWENKTKHRAIFREAFSAPVGFRQAAIYESLESAVCDPAARGEGTIKDDIFALGVTLFFLSIGKNPLANMAEEELISRRIDQGTFDLYTSQFSVPLTILEGLRGMLADDPAERWGLEDVEGWVRGSRQAVKQPRGQRSGSRPFLFADKNYLYLPSLVYGFTRNWARASEVIRNKSLDNWLRRSLSDEVTADRAQKTVNPSGSTSKNISDDLLIAKTCIALDPQGPIRYKSFIGTVEGLGTALAMAMGTGDKDKISLITQIINHRLPLTWIGVQETQDRSYINISSKFELLPSMLDSRLAGFGLERALYEMHPELPCFSPNFDGHYVAEAKDALPVLETISNQPTRPGQIFDRHFAAFLAARMPELKDGDLRTLSTGGPAVQALSALRLLAKMQRIHKVKDTPGITRWSLDILRPVFASYMNVARRQRITDSVHAIAKTGTIADILLRADNEEERLVDEAGYKRAAIEFAGITLRIANLEEMRKREKEIAQIKGERTALYLSGLMTGFFLVALFYLNFT